MLAAVSMTPKADAFVVNVRDCPVVQSTSNPVYEFDFNKFAAVPDVTVLVAPSVYEADLSIGVTTDPKQANLLLADDFNQADIAICRSRSWMSSGTDITSIKVDRFAMRADIKVELTTSTVGKDYVLFNASEDFSDEEAAAFFAVLWARVQQEQVPTETAYQLQYRRGGEWVGGPVYARRWDCSDAQWAPGVVGARCVEVQVPRR